MRRIHVPNTNLGRRERFTACFWTVVLFFNLLYGLYVESRGIYGSEPSSIDAGFGAVIDQLNSAASVAGCDPLPLMPFDSPIVCDQVRTIGLGASGSTFVSYVLGEIGSMVGWKKGVLHDHSREVDSYDFCSLAMVRDFRDIVCSTLRRKENCMKCSPKALTARRGILKEAYEHNFPRGFLDELYFRHAGREITVVRYGNVYPIECARQFFSLWVPEYFGIKSQIELSEILEIVNKYSIESQKERLEEYKGRLRKKKKDNLERFYFYPGTFWKSTHKPCFEQWYPEQLDDMLHRSGQNLVEEEIEEALDQI